MAYDRYGTRNDPRDERSRWRGERDFDRGNDRDWANYNQAGRDERGFFERAGDEVASWFGDEEAERRRREDRMRLEREQRGYGGYGTSSREGRFERGRDFERNRFDRDEDRGPFSRSSYRGYGGEGAYRQSTWGSEPYGEPERGYRPMTGDYGRGDFGRNEGFFAAGGTTRGEYEGARSWRDRDLWDRDYRRQSERGHDPHYRSWRERHMGELDRDYDEFSRENQARFEDEFTNWRERRMQKRGLLGRIREHMEVVGDDDLHVGTIDRVAGDRIILTKSDPESGGVHHSLSCSDIDQVEDERVILDCSAEQAKQRWRDESRSRALFEREDQGEMGPGTLNRSFEGTYRQR
jgi:hypothetical protein